MLNSDEILPNERYVVLITEHADHPSVINPRDQDGEKVREESRLFLKVERESLKDTSASSTQLLFMSTDLVVTVR